MCHGDISPSLNVRIILATRMLRVDPPSLVKKVDGRLLMVEARSPAAAGLIEFLALAAFVWLCMVRARHIPAARG
jgi:hypothetical protein